MLIARIENKVFGAVVKDVELRSVSDSDFSNIHAALLEYGFLVFPSQFLTKNENISFGERFGPLEFAATPFSNAESGKEGSYSKIFVAKMASNDCAFFFILCNINSYNRSSYSNVSSWSNDCIVFCRNWLGMAC